MPNDKDIELPSLDLTVEEKQQVIDTIRSDEGRFWALRLVCRERQLKEAIAEVDRLEEELDPCCRNPRCGGDCTCKICAPDLYIRDLETELTELKQQSVDLREALAFIAYGKQHTGIIPCPQDYHFYISPFRDRAREALDALNIPEENEETD